jgi:hypothetical protein
MHDHQTVTVVEWRVGPAIRRAIGTKKIWGWKW